MKIGITGATGLIGNALGERAAVAGHEMVAYTRRPDDVDLPWALEKRRLNADADLPLDASGLDCLVHLAGESILGLWTPAKMTRIRESRVDLTLKIARCLAEASPRPSVLLSGSAVGFYGDCGDRLVDEGTPAGADFLARVCADWEAAAQRVEQLGVRVVHLRTGLVLAREGGSFPLMKTAFMWGLGGRLGSGQQFMPWVHLQDEVRLILHAATRRDISGAMNLTAPGGVTNAAFTRALAAALNRLAILPAPAFMLRLLLRGMAGVLLGGQRARPRIAEETGFEFDFPELGGALADLLRRH
jgi:uncharacterized protein (TIGR01777 family)